VSGAGDFFKVDYRTEGIHNKSSYGVERMKRKIMMTELERLNHKGLLDDENFKKIREYYEYERENSKSFSTYLTIIGLVMIALGIILLFAYNWNHLSRGVKTSLIIICLICSQGLLGYALWKEKKWSGGAGVLVFAISGLSIAMISQMYNISGSETGFYMTWVVLNIPNLYLCRSKLVGIPYAAILSLYLMSDGYILLYLLLTTPLFLFDKAEGRYSEFGETMVKVIVLLGIFHWYEGLWYEGLGLGYLPFYGGVFTLLYLWPVGMKKGAELVIIGIAYIGTFGRGGHLIPEITKFTTKPILSWGVFIAALLSLIYLKKWKDPVNYFILLIVPIVYSGAEELICNIYLFSLGVYFVWNGVKENTVKIFNKGSLLVSVILLSRFLDYDISTLLRGIVFILLGISLVSGNIYMSRRKL